MKTALFNHIRPAFERPAGRARPWHALVVLAVLLTAATASAVGTVDTLGGGRYTGYPDDFGFVNGNTYSDALFNVPSGLALDTSGTVLYVADRANNAVRKITNVGNQSASQTSTFAAAAQGVSAPVAVVVDGADDVYVLNRGNGANGSVLKFNKYANPLGAQAANLVNATALALDGSANIYVTVANNTVLRISSTSTSVVGIVTTPGTLLNGLAVLDSGMVALSDGGNHGVWLLNPDNGNVTALTGFNGAGDTFGTAPFVQLKNPAMIAKAGDGLLVIADRDNHRVKVVDTYDGTVTPLYGVDPDLWLDYEGMLPGWWDGPGTPYPVGTEPYAEAREPVGLTVGPDGTVYSTEVYYHIIRKTTGSGLTGPGSGGGGGGSGTNVVVITPTISPNAGYFPMGQTIIVTSPNPDVFYTVDGTVPTLTSPRVPMNGNTGVIRWGSSTRDLTSLRVRAYIGTNASVTVSGRAVLTNSIGVPAGLTPQIQAGVGSTVVLPVVVNLRSNDRVRSLQFRVEVTPDAGNPNNVSDQFRTLSILANDFVPVVTAAQGATSGVYSASAYATSAGGGRTNRGLAISAIATNANIIFSNYAVVTMLAVPVPKSAVQGQTYSVTVMNASASSDGLQTPVNLPLMPAATILVTNVPYTVGDSSPGRWYNAGDFGNGDLDNADVNNTFYASLGQRVPHSFSDAYNSMDTFPADGPGFVGGDGLIRFLDWQLVLQRSLRLNTNNWKRMWTASGGRTNSGPLALPQPQFNPPPQPSVSADTWYRQALVGADSVGNVSAGAWVNVPVYVKTVAGASLSGLQFRVGITPDGAAPALGSSPEFIAAEGVNPPGSLASLSDGLLCGWPLGSVSLGSQSSNRLGYVRFAAPLDASAGQTYIVSLAFADGAPDITTAYNFETRSAEVKILSPTAPASISSDEWRAHYFAGADDPAAADSADADHDGALNWQEFIAGTDPTKSDSKLEFRRAETVMNGGQKQLALRWQTVPGKVYEVLQSTSANGPGWTWRQTVQGDGSEAEFIETQTSGSAGFFRLRVQ